ncbi:MAG: carboxypeptidase regulatory-like domain-containing protein [Bradymonadales bacterium]|nr:carboxypeptidase regulatory-like domain-containing protein [Bradymonadales bacterium]
MRRIAPLCILTISLVLSGAVAAVRPEVSDEPSGYELSGQVSVPTGMRPAGIAVLVVDSGLYTTTDAEGSFGLPPLPSGPYDLLLLREDLRDKTVSVEVEQEDLHLVIAMEPAALLTGHLLLENPADPLQGSTVTFADRSTQTDEEGWYLLDLGQNEPSTVRFEREGYLAAEVTLAVRGMDRLDVELQAAGEHRLTGTVGDGLEPVLGAQVLFQGSEASEPREQQTDEGGRFQFERCPPGSYRLVVTAPGFERVVVDPLALFSDLDLKVILTSVVLSELPSCTTSGRISLRTSRQRTTWLLLSIGLLAGLCRRRRVENMD